MPKPEWDACTGKVRDLFEELEKSKKGKETSKALLASLKDGTSAEHLAVVLTMHTGQKFAPSTIKEQRRRLR